MSSEAVAILDPAAIGRWGRALGRLAHWRYRRFARLPAHGVRLEPVAGFALLVLPGVLNPRLMRTGEFFAQALPALLPAGGEILDLGTGSGICALAAARQARRVVAVDISPEAVRCARLNIALNHLETRIEVHAGDLFAPVASRRFDVVLFNPPFFRGRPRDDSDRAWRSEDIPERFAAELGAHLQPSGFALLLLSTFGDARAFLEALACAGFRLEAVARRRFVNEQLALFRVTR